MQQSLDFQELQEQHFKLSLGSLLLSFPLMLASRHLPNCFPLLHILLVREERTFPRCKDLMFVPPHWNDVLNVVCKIPLRV